MPPTGKPIKINAGDVDEITARIMACVRRRGDHWLWTGHRIRQGYGVISVYGKQLRAHRVVWAIYNGDPGKLCVLHTCDIPHCIRPQHLFLGTQLDNIADATAKGRMRCNEGASNGNAKLTTADVRAIRSLAMTGRFTTREIARLFPCGEGNVSAILNGRTRRKQ